MVDPIEDIKRSQRKKQIERYENMLEGVDETEGQDGPGAVGTIQGKNVKNITTKPSQSNVKKLFDNTIKNKSQS